MITEIFNYMPQVATEEDMLVSARICGDEKVFSDESGISNKDKWDFVKTIFSCSDCSLFSAISFEDIYDDDDPHKCEAAGYVADLRTQYLNKVLAKEPSDLASHALYVRNRQWQAKLRERVNLKHLEDSMRGTRLT